MNATAMPDLVVQHDDTWWIRQNTTTRSSRPMFADWKPMETNLQLENGKLIDFDRDGHVELLYRSLGFFSQTRGWLSKSSNQSQI